MDIEWENGQLVQANVREDTDRSFRIYSEDTMSEVISLRKDQSIAWPEKGK